MSYWLYVNRVRKRACWHRDGCGYIKMNGGKSESDQDWYQCQTLEEVQRLVNRETRGYRQDQIRPCSKCMAAG